MIGDTRSVARAAKLGVALLVAALLAASCGSDDDSGNGSETTASGATTALTELTTPDATETDDTATAANQTDVTDTASTDGGAADGPVAAGIAAAQKFVEPYLSIPTDIGISEPLDGTLEGKTVMFLECGASNCKEFGDLMEAPVALLGAKFVRVPSGGTPEDFAAAYDTAIAARPDVVVSPAINFGFVSAELDQLEEMGIPVVSQATGEEPTNGVDKELVSREMWEKAGRVAAAFVTVDSGGAANVLYIKESVFTFANPQFESFEKGLAEFCPECTVTKLEVPFTDIGTAIPGEVVSAFQKNPDLNYITDSYGPQVTGVREALGEAGIEDYTLFNQAGVAFNIQQVLDGTAVADMQVSPKFDAWALTDAAARAVLGQDLDAIDDPNLPWIFIATKETVNWDPNTEDFEGVVGLEEQFKELWGVS